MVCDWLLGWLVPDKLMMDYPHMHVLAGGWSVGWSVVSWLVGTRQAHDGLSAYAFWQVVVCGGGEVGACVWGGGQGSTVGKKISG